MMLLIQVPVSLDDHTPSQANMHLMPVEPFQIYVCVPGEPPHSIRVHSGTIGTRARNA